MPQFFDIVLHHRIVVHMGIHGRGNDFFAFARHHRSGQHIIGYPIGQLSDDIGRRRGNQHHVRAFRQRNMFNAVLKITVESIDQAFVSCQCLKSNRMNKINRIPCH